MTVKEAIGDLEEPPKSSPNHIWSLVSTSILQEVKIAVLSVFCAGDSVRKTG